MKSFKYFSIIIGVGLIFFYFYSQIVFSTGEILFQDDFNQNASQWTPFNNPETWSWTSNEGINGSGAYKHNGQADDAVSMYSENNWTDYRFEADVKILTGSRIGLLFRGSTEPKGTSKWKKLGGYYLFLFPKKNKLVLKRHQYEGECSTSGQQGTGCWPLHPSYVINVAEADYNLSINTWYNLAVEIQGNNIKGYVDNNLVLQAQDNSFSSGTVGFKTYKGSIVVDNVKVQSLATNNNENNDNNHDNLNNNLDNQNNNNQNQIWKESSIFPSGKTTEIPRSFAIGDYYYVIPKSSGGYIIKAKQQTDGNLSEWSETYKQSGIKKTHGYPVLTINNNGYLMPYCSVFQVNTDTNGEITSLTEMNPDKDNDGQVDGFNGECYVWGTAVLADFGTSQYVLNFGGIDPFAGDVALATINRTVPSISPPWQWEKIGDLGIYGRSATFYRSGDNGYIFLTRDEESNNLYQLTINPQGEIGSLETIGSLPEGYGTAEIGELIVIGKYLYVIGGDDNMGNKVFRAQINDNGTLSTWENMADLPGPANHVGYGIINDYLYVTGVDRVYYTNIETSPENQCSNSKKGQGDANNDNQIDNLDYFYFVQAINGGNIPPEIDVDFNCDGQINTADQEIIVRTLSSKEY